MNRLLVASAVCAVALAAGCKKAPAPALEAPATQPAMPNTPEARKAMKMPVIPVPRKQGLYPPLNESADADIKTALKQAHKEHKNVILDFGGDWCGDCQVLDVYFHQAPNEQLLNDNFVKVNVNIGHDDANVDIAKRYGVPLEGVPALAVLGPDGKVLFAQNKEFSDMRYMESTSVTQFLDKWKPAK